MLPQVRALVQPLALESRSENRVKRDADDKKV